MEKSKEFQQKTLKVFEGPIEKYAFLMGREINEKQMKTRVMSISFYYPDEYFLPLLFKMMLKNHGPRVNNYSEYFSQIYSIVLEMVEIMEVDYTYDEINFIAHIISYQSADFAAKQDLLNNESFEFLMDNGPLETSLPFLVVFQKEIYDAFYSLIRVKTQGRPFSYEWTKRLIQIQTILGSQVIKEYLSARDQTEYLRR